MGVYVLFFFTLIVDVLLIEVGSGCFFIFFFKKWCFFDVVILERSFDEVF